MSDVPPRSAGDDVEDGGIMIVVIAPPGHQRRPSNAFSEAIVEEFDTLLVALDGGVLTREQWDRLKTILAIATLEAGDAERGGQAYDKALSKWRTSIHYDGED